ncbi:MAG: c-type cytochrome biogenesis protein [Lonepinella koalarum]|nr:c-type cytochrome biogenesis protein [Lonepinella koalarum]
MMILTLGIAAFALIALLVFVPFGKQIDWQKNYRQQKNIALYEQQMNYRPSSALADELAQRLLNDEAQLQQHAPKSKSAVKNPIIFSFSLWVVLLVFPLAYYFSLQRLAIVQQGEAEFKQMQHQLRNATTTEKNRDYIVSVQHKLRQNPNDGEAWIELGQAYVLSNEFEHALIAYHNAEGLLGSKPAILGLAATALYYQAGQKITPKAQQLIDEALKQDAKETSVLSLLASNAFLHNDYAQALGLWQQLLDSERAEVDRRKTIESMRMAETLLKAQQSREP